MPIPPIDFSKDMVLGVFLGTRGNTCFSVTIESVEQVAQQRLNRKISGSKKWAGL